MYIVKAKDGLKTQGILKATDWLGHYVKI